MFFSKKNSLIYWMTLVYIYIYIYIYIYMYVCVCVCAHVCVCVFKQHFSLWQSWLNIIDILWLHIFISILLNRCMYVIIFWLELAENFHLITCKNKSPQISKTLLIIYQLLVIFDKEKIFPAYIYIYIHNKFYINRYINICIYNSHLFMHIWYSYIYIW